MERMGVEYRGNKFGMSFYLLRLGNGVRGYDYTIVHFCLCLNFSIIKNVERMSAKKRKETINGTQ
jgi:hypothetical protein